ncbi:MAG: hypothetical protein ACR2HK_02700, partial [Gemmatimonadales bacterium]
MRGLRPLLLLIATGASSTSLEAQSAQPISFQLSGLFNGVFGDAFTGLQDGLGTEAQSRYTPSALSIGAGFQYTSHSLEGRLDDARLYG